MFGSLLTPDRDRAGQLDMVWDRAGGGVRPFWRQGLLTCRPDESTRRE
ncbi:hypothetical protein [Micromonospora palythoicola]